MSSRCCETAVTTLLVCLLSTATPFLRRSSSSSSAFSISIIIISRSIATMMRSALLVLALTAVCSGILPEIVDSGINHIPEGRAWEERMFEGVEQPPEDPQLKPEDAAPQTNQSVRDLQDNLPLINQNDLLIDKDSMDSSADQETLNNTEEVQAGELGNNIDDGCVSDDDCGKERYCFYDTHDSKCRQCKDTDESCSKDVECCGEQLCMWGQCSQNATKGKAGSTCQYQSDCSPELCCAFHKALLFPVCLAKPIERERCLDSSNHLMELLSWDVQDEGPRRHCPCVGDLHCQHLGRGSMCLKGEDSSEEDLTDSLYSEIDYIL
ncbi:Dickkopf-related protein 3 [Oryzias melastigma]|uniref:Dickkopf-related protein 3 n=1 Tax=Oryzias melastigma TaxID=30732 RepID=A0A834BZE3_ORYME|nr:Dickkopf-related protein 3 [Oryzias melastigma]